MLMIKVDGLEFTYPDGTAVLKEVSLELSFEKEEHITAIVGRSGSGKTTLLQCLARFLMPRLGSIEIDGVAAHSMTEAQFRSKVGVVFQNLYLFPHLTVLDNLTLAPVQVAGMARKQAEQEAREMLERVGVGDLADSYPAQLSGGQAQRVAIARALLLKPDFLLLDEPTSALDINTTNALARLLQSLCDSTNFIIVTHDIPFVRMVANRAILVSDGRVVTHDTVERVMEIFQQEEKQTEQVNA
jgi:ABC-type polar amino acid transport system ATPase subunit